MGSQTHWKFGAVGYLRGGVMSQRDWCCYTDIPTELGDGNHPQLLLHYSPNLALFSKPRQNRQENIYIQNIILKIKCVPASLHCLMYVTYLMLEDLGLIRHLLVMHEQTESHQGPWVNLQVGLFLRRKMWVVGWLGQNLNNFTCSSYMLQFSGLLFV